jgi:hypothetical protein
MQFFFVSATAEAPPPDIPTAADFWQQIWENPHRDSRRQLKREPLATKKLPSSYKPMASTQQSKKRKYAEHNSSPRPNKQIQILAVTPAPTEDLAMPTNFQGFVDLIYHDFKMNHPKWDFPFNIVSLVPTAKALSTPIKLFSDRYTMDDDKPPMEPNHKINSTTTNKMMVARDAVLRNGQIVQNVPALFDVYSISSMKRLSRSHLKICASNRVLASHKCNPTRHIRHIYGAIAASHPQVVPASIEIVSVLSRLTLFQQVNAVIAKLCLDKENIPTVDTSVLKIAHCSPSASSIEKWVLETAIGQDMIMARLVATCNVFCQSDGGQNGQEVRLLNIWDVQKSSSSVPEGGSRQYLSGLTFTGKKSNQVAQVFGTIFFVFPTVQKLRS